VPTTFATIGDSHRPLRDKVVDELRRRIVDGEYAPGARLTEERLAGAFGVSRNPVREAIRVLESEGFLVAQPRRGAVVAQICEQDIRDLFDIRLALEVLATRLVAERSGPACAASLGSIVRAAAETSDLDELAGLNTRFHATICAFCGNNLLAGMMESLHTKMQWVYRQSAAVRAPHSWAEHEALATAIRAGDGDAAAAAARTHVMNARASAMSLMASPRVPLGDADTEPDGSLASSLTR
jgi:DNA-binding GntR family transcriptional regulator